MTNPVIEAIKNRQSIRAYEAKPVPRDIINMIIEAGNQAPSQGRDEEGTNEPVFPCWRFVVVENPEFRQKLVQTTLPIWKKTFAFMKMRFPAYYEKVRKFDAAMGGSRDAVYHSAPVILFIIGPSDDPVSPALACENIMLAAYSLGLGSCYVGFGSMVKGNKEILQALELKDNERIFGPIVLGYPKDIPEARALRPKKKDPEIKWI